MAEPQSPGTDPVSLTPLTPLSLLERSADVFAERTAIVHGPRRISYAAFAAETTRIARALQAVGVGPGDRVACLLPNVPEMLVAHFAVPLAGAVLVAVNTRLSPDEVRYILEHSGSRVLVVDDALLPTVAAIADPPATLELVVVLQDGAPGSGPGLPDGGAADPDGTTAGPLPGVTTLSYPQLRARGSDDPLPWSVADENGTIAINYTSGTTGRPKGVQYSHRGAYLNSLAELLHSKHSPESVYLWTLPMFHCNGWCMPWALTGIGGTHVCLREVRGDAMWQLIDEHRVTHLNGAPPVLTTLLRAEQAHPVDRPFVVTTAGAPPSPTTLVRMEQMGFTVVHVYGLTETYGPHTVNEFQQPWRELDPEQRAARLSRQGVGMLHTDPIRVVDSGMRDVPRDGATLGEIVMRGNNVMTGYYRDPEATAKAFAGGWFHSGDLAVWHPDGYVEIRDRAKDIVISGGENISTVEVEQALTSHPEVVEAGVIGVPDEQWGERPRAYVVLEPGAAVTPDALVEHVRSRIARYKAPREVVVVDALPKTSTGKIQKQVLRERAAAD